MKSASSAPKSTSTRCTTPDLRQNECGEARGARCRFRPPAGLKSTNCLLFASRLQHQVKKHNLIVASYDVVRNDIDFFRCVFT